MTRNNVLIADIGGTNARFALSNHSRPGYSDELNLQCADFAGIDQAIYHYLDHVGSTEPDAICLAVAGPVVNQQVQMTNNAWFLSVEEISRYFANSQVYLINDFTAIALSLPLLNPDDYLSVGPEASQQASQKTANIAVLGPGTGLGVAGLIREPGRYLPLTGEAGHMGFAAVTPQQIEVLDILRERWPRISIERLLSGPGIENLYWALNHQRAHPETSLNAAQIFAEALERPDSLANDAVQVFFEILGQVAGDIALAYGAYQAVYIAGGMVKRYPQFFNQSRFRKAFENKGRHRSIMEGIPTRLVLHPQPGLLGASQFAIDQKNRTG